MSGQEGINLRHKARVSVSSPVSSPVTSSVISPVTSSVPVATQSPYQYKHNVDTCACGTCYKARVDSGMK
uniref:Uncharacterized protein n=1 Tax=viral metagenome TaxID=1070528 RepID=A0A6C0ANK1_9ZZZZ